MRFVIPTGKITDEKTFAPLPVLGLFTFSNEGASAAEPLPPSVANAEVESSLIGLENFRNPDLENGASLYHRLDGSNDAWGDLQNLSETEISDLVAFWSSIQN